MGMIGRWIDERCAQEPDVMRRVLNRKFGNLERYVAPDGCGCLVGSYGLIRGDGWTEQSGYPAGRHDLVMLGFQVARLLMWRGNRCADDPEAFRHKRTQADVVRLLKQRIRKALGIAPVREVVSGSAVVDSEALQK